MMQKTKLDLKSEPKILQGLNKEQLQAVQHKDGPLLIVAGAGTGKTTVITRRIAYLIEQGLKPESILAMAFGDKAALEMEERVDQLLPYGYYNLQISTFHSFCERILKEYGLEIGLPDFKVLNETNQWMLIRQNLDKLDLDYYRPLGNPTRFIKAIVSHFARAKDELINPAEYLAYAEKIELDEDHAEAGVEDRDSEIRRVKEIANAYHVYQKLLLDSNSLDFGDLINYTLKLFKEKPKVLARLRERYQHILIDEFQDTNYAQYELIKLLAAPQNNIVVVGDDDQSIFKFRGASISNILHFKKDYKNAQFISLTQNYRSGQKVLDQAYDFIRQNDPDRLESKLKIPKKLKNLQNDTGTVDQITFPDYVSEARGVLEKMLEGKAQKPSASWNDFAILARSHQSLEPFISELEAKDIPYIYFANRGLYRKPIILNLISYFRLLGNYHENQAIFRVLNLPVFAISNAAIIEINHYARKKSLSVYESLKQKPVLEKLGAADAKGIEKLLTMLKKHAQMATEKSVGQLFVQIIEDLQLVRQVSGNNHSSLQDAKYLEGFSRKVLNFQSENADKSFGNFMRQLLFEIEAGEQGELEFDPEAGPDAVKLMTVHGAKGLEFECVFVVGLVDKRFPTIERREEIEIPTPLIKDILPEGDVHLQEERRLFYVAMTRAKNFLYLTRALDYGGKLTKKPSRFLIELGLAQQEVSKPTGQARISSQTSPLALPVPKYFSFSQISAFRKCPLEYKYRYVLGLPVPGAASLSFGLTIHKTFEKFLRRMMQRQRGQDLFGEVDHEAELPKFEMLEQLYRDNWIDDWFDSSAQKERYRKEGIAMLKSFYVELQAVHAEPKFLEESFRLKVDGAWFIGKIDRADLTRDGLTIIDYKTGAPRPIDKVDKQQLLIYQWAVQEYFKEKVKDLQYWFLRDKLSKTSFLGTDKEIKNLKHDIHDTIAQIIDATQSNSFDLLDRRISHECKYRDLEI